MKIERYKRPLSSFLSVDKDIETIMDMLWNNVRLKRLLYRKGRDALNSENLTEEESVKLFEEEYITNVPKLPVDSEEKNYIVVSFNKFSPTPTNPHYRDNFLIVDVVCHFDQWRLEGFQLRPFKIVGEVDSMLDGARLSGIGVLNFVCANYITIGNEYGGYSLVYKATHSEDDQKNFNNPADEERFLEDIISNG